MTIDESSPLKPLDPELSAAAKKFFPAGSVSTATFAGFVEDLGQIVGKEIAAVYESDGPRLLLVFTDGMAALIIENTSGCYYEGESGGMMIEDEPARHEIAKAREMYEEWRSRH